MVPVALPQLLLLLLLGQARAGRLQEGRQQVQAVQQQGRHQQQQARQISWGAWPPSGTSWMAPSTG